MNDDDKFEENLNDIEPIKTQYSVFNKRYNSFFKIKNLDKLKRNIDRKKKTFDFFSLSNNENTEFKTPQNNYINYKKLIPLNHDLTEINNSFLKKFNNEIEMVKQKMDKIEKKNNNEMKKKKSKSFSIDQLRNQIIGDPGRYNPNYNSIYKKPYYPFFRKSTISYFDQFKINKKNKKKKIKIKSLSNSLEIVKKNTKYYVSKHLNKSMDDLHDCEINIKNKYDKEKIKSTKVFFEKMNSHLKKKKNLFLYNNKTDLENSFNKIINRNSINSKKKNSSSIINFNKMKERKYKIISSYGNNFNFYSPNYEPIFPHIPSIKMENEISFQNLKQYLSNKIMRNYKFYSNEFLDMKLNK